jgi:hypothetical protein
MKQFVLTTSLLVLFCATVVVGSDFIDHSGAKSVYKTVTTSMAVKLIGPCVSQAQPAKANQTVHFEMALREDGVDEIFASLEQRGEVVAAEVHAQPEFRPRSLMRDLKPHYGRVG